MQEELKKQSAGNQSVIDALEEALRYAREGNVRAAGIIFCEAQGTKTGFHGDGNARANIGFGCDMLKHMLLQSAMTIQDMKRRPPADRVQFDLYRNSICFDAVLWLAAKEMARRREGAPAPLKVKFTEDAVALTQNPTDREAFANHVVRPALALFGAVESMLEGRTDDNFGVNDIVNGFYRGEEVPQIQVPDAAMAAIDLKYLKNRRPVTITLRECGYNEHRNSNIDAWRELAHWLYRYKAQDVIVVRDTAKATEEFYGFQTCPEASVDLHARAALYRQAKLNMFVCNGPFTMALFGKTPWLLFAAVGDNEPEICQTRDGWRTMMGCEVGGQVPWATPQQRIIYKHDTFENMRAAYEELGL
jgi:hypothetical protein